MIDRRGRHGDRRARHGIAWHGISGDPLGRGFGPWGCEAVGLLAWVGGGRDEGVDGVSGAISEVRFGSHSESRPGRTLPRNARQSTASGGWWWGRRAGRRLGQWGE
eukprot:2702013-Pyramimonas_sp.AAC.1